MGKRRRVWSEKVDLRSLQEGRGQEDLASTHDFSSQGKVTRIKGVITNRIHHLMSGLELCCFLFLEILPNGYQGAVFFAPPRHTA